MSTTFALTSLVLFVSHIVVFGPRLLQLHQTYNEQQLQLAENANKDKAIDTGFITINEKTYYYGKALISNLTFYEAECICSLQNKALMSFETVEEYKIIEEFYLQNPAFADLWFWTSGRRLAGGKWIWTGSDVDVTETSWGPNEPHLDPTSHACIKFKASFGGWADDSCDAVLDSYICEA